MAAVPGAVRARAAQRSGKQRLIVIMCDGGWDSTFVCDPKFHSPEIDGPWVDEKLSNPEDREAPRSFGELSIGVNDFKRPAVTQFFERWSSQVAVVNGVWVGSLAHPPCRLRILTGSSDMKDASVASIVGAGLGSELPLGTVDLSGIAFTGPLAASSGQVGLQNQLKLLVRDDATFQPPADGSVVYPQFAPSDSDRDALFAHLQARNEALAGRHGDAKFNAKKFADRLEALTRANRFRVLGGDVLDSLEFGASPSLVEQSDLAIELLQRDLCATVSLNSGSFWDTHSNNVLQHGHWEKLFTGLSHLAQRLDEEDMLATTTVAVVSEMTRTPRINTKLGKDHWPHASALLFGGGIQGGRSYGATDDRGESLRVDFSTGVAAPSSGTLVRYDHFAAGLVAAMGVDPGPWFGGIEPYMPFAG
jgi:hypothetical protein